MERADALRPVDAGAIRLAKTLLRTARHGALATLDPAGGGPRASRVGVATLPDGTPLVLVSALSAHTAALVADPRCGLLLGEPGKGDPLAHPRLSLSCRARRIARGSDGWAAAERRYLARHPRARLYAGLGDFSFFRLDPAAAALNAGFGRAFEMEGGAVRTGGPFDALAAMEAGAVEHMNADHADAIALYAAHFAGQRPGRWRITGLDPDGLDLAAGDRVARVFFAEPLREAAELRQRLVEMARQARASPRDP